MIVIVIYISFIILYGLVKRINCYDSFKTGVYNNYKILLDIFPNLLAIVFAVEVFSNCGIPTLVNNYLNELIIPVELILQAFFKPISSQSSMIFMINIFNKFGVDSLIGNLSSIIQGCSDTTFYIITLYFSCVKIKDYKYALKVGLLTDFLTFVIISFLYLILKL